MRKIHRLPQHLIAKIAAGEVIERPAFAVKELIENSLDAKATRVEVEIEESGMRRITVLDNGEGMTKDDLEICFLPHTTSKLKGDEELQRIKTLGFRGEALSSIAAVSHMTLITRTGKDIGGRIIQIRGGIVEDSAPVGSPIGTIVTVEGIFYSVPARKKFLKSAQTEFRHISEMMSRFALIHPQVHFILRHNKKTVFDFPPKNDLRERIRLLLGPTIFDQLLKINYEDGQIHIEGYIGKPQAALKQNLKQYIYVNTRHVTDKMISLSVKEAFGSLLPSSHTPVFILHLTVPYDFVDVNIHPRKEQISFINHKQVFDIVKAAVLQTLSENNITFQLAKFKQEYSAKISETTAAAGIELKHTVLPWNRKDQVTALEKETFEQLYQTYILAITEEQIFFIDQHAAHERILYERFLQEFTDQQMKQHTLKEPITLHLSLSEAQTVEEYFDILQNAGFILENFSGNSYLLRSIPKGYEGRGIEKIIRELLAELATDKTLKTVDIYSERMLAFLSCRAAIKAEDPLDKKQMKNLFVTLMKTSNNETCPHGRPTMTILSREDLNKLFRR